MERYIRLFKESSWIFFGKIVAMGSSLVLVRVLTDNLNPDQYGQLALALTISGLITQVVMGGIINAIGAFFILSLLKIII